MIDHQKRNVAKDIVILLLSTATLYAGVVSIITLVFQYINVWFPDPLDYYGQSRVYDAVNTSMAILVVVWPVYLFLTRLIVKDERKNPEHKNLTSRRWFSYITIFLATVTVIIDLITLIHKFLGGDLSTQFFLKVFVVLVVAGSVFAYYLWDVRKKQLSQKIPKLSARLASLVLLISVTGGFFIVGTPSQQRLKKFDQQRVNDLNIIQSEIIRQWQQKGHLPQALSHLKDDISGFQAPTDPKTKKPYEYQILSNLTFELCSNFETENKDTVQKHSEQRPRSIFMGDHESDSWTHNKGRFCFERTIDPQLYPTQPIKEQYTQKGSGDIIRVVNPKPNQEIISPLRIFGEARGSWFFEASFPVSLTDESGNIIARHYATANDEWMTAEFVPFSTDLEFIATKNITRGILILHKSNASGLPEHSDSLKIPVRFYQSTP